MSRPPVRIRSLVLVLAVAGLAWPPAAAAQPRNCSLAAKNLYVRDLLHEYYYWYQHLPDPDPTRYPSPEAYLEAVRYRPLDETFSYITSRAASEALFSASQYIGFGFSNQSELSADQAEVEMRVNQVYPDSSASEAGLQRGDRILAVAGRSVTDWWLAGQLGTAFGPSEVGYQTTLLFQRDGLEPVEVSVTKRLVTIPTVSDVKVFERPGMRVGYIFFRNFVQPSVEALDAAFSQLAQAGARELVLDLRYNGGGLVTVAQHLASLIGGARTNGQVLGEYVHNDKNTSLNETIRFQETPNALTLDRLIVITTRGSASASELIINGLRPFIPVIVVGDRTYGKPVGQYAFDFCDKTAAIVAFSLKNANGEGDFFGGIPATCAVGDDLGHEIGDPAEASLAEALTFVERGSCSAPPSDAARARRLRLAAIRESGFQQLVGAQ